MNEFLETVANQAAGDVKAQIKDGEEGILKAIEQATVTSQDEDKPLSFTLTLKIKMDLENNKITNQLSWTERHKLEISHEIENPNQGKLFEDKKS